MHAGQNTAENEENTINTHHVALMIFFLKTKHADTFHSGTSLSAYSVLWRRVRAHCLEVETEVGQKSKLKGEGEDRKSKL